MKLEFLGMLSPLRMEIQYLFEKGLSRKNFFASDEDSLDSDAPAENRTRGPTMATLDFTTKPLVLDARPCKNIYKPYHSPTTSNNKHKQHHKHRAT